MLNTSLSVVFSIDPTSNSTTTTTNPFPQFPWIYDPMLPDNWQNMLGRCDKWIADPWVGFTYHAPAIAYKKDKEDKAKAELDAQWKQAQDQYYKDCSAYWNNQANLPPNKRYPSVTLENASAPIQVGVNYSLTTTGVSGGYTSNSGYGTPPPSTNFSVSFSPVADPNQTPNKPQGVTDPAKAECPILKWSLFYEGKFDWEWFGGGEWNNWGAVAVWQVVPQTGYYIVGGKPAKIPRIANKPTGWYFFYEPEYNVIVDPMPEGTIRPFREIWDTLVTETQTLKVDKLVTVWYNTQPIDNIPVPASRIETPVPATFKADVTIDYLKMYVAIGYIFGPDKRSCVTSHEGTAIDVIPYATYTPLPDDITNKGVIKLSEFSFRNEMHYYLNWMVTEEMWQSHGEHILEFIDMGVDAALTIKDTETPARAITKTENRSPKCDYYVPNVHKGEFIFRKKWKVFNPADYNGRVCELLYEKKYGQLGIKRVVELTNPLELEIIFVIDHEAYMGGWVEWYSMPDGNKTVIKVAPNTSRRVTCYGGNWQKDFKCEYYIGGKEYELIPDLTSITETQEQTYFKSKLDKCPFPKMRVFKANARYGTPPDVVELPSMNERIPVGIPVAPTDCQRTGAFVTGVGASKAVYNAISDNYTYTSLGTYNGFSTLINPAFIEWAHISNDVISGVTIKHYSPYLTIDPDIATIYEHAIDIHEDRYFNNHGAYYMKKHRLGGAVDRFVLGDWSTLCDPALLVSKASSYTLDLHHSGMPTMGLALRVPDPTMFAWADFINYWDVSGLWSNLTPLPNYLGISEGTIVSGVPVTMEASFIGYVKEGWDNSPIRVMYTNQQPEYGYFATLYSVHPSWTENTGITYL
jgi:hypothetical protein